MSGLGVAGDSRQLSGDGYGVTGVGILINLRWNCGLTRKPHNQGDPHEKLSRIESLATSNELVEMIYRLTQKFPKHETYGLMSQLQRAIVSVPSNIAEGHTREHLREYLHHISIAQASLAEVETQVELATRLEYVQPAELKEILSEINSLGRQLYALRNSLRTRLN